MVRKLETRAPFAGKTLKEKYLLESSETICEATKNQYLMKITADWIVGFVDGDGHFGVSKTQVGTNRFYFGVSQDERSVQVLYQLKTFFKCGRVQKNIGQKWEYRVNVQKHLVDIIIPFFEKHALKTTKQKAFETMARGCFESLEMKKQPAVDLVNSKLTPEWLVGFIDAQGSFVCSLINPQLGLTERQFVSRVILGLNSKDAAILDRIKSYLGYGDRYTNQTGEEILQLSAQEDNYRFINDYLLTKGSKDRLRTHKRIIARRWSKIVLLVQTNQHTTLLGWEKVYQKYKLFKTSVISSDILVEDRVRPVSKETE